MRSESPSSHRVAAPLAHRIGDDATAEQIAAALAAVWLELDAVMSPIIGPRGVAALGQRSLHLVRATYPWLALAAGQPGEPAKLDPALLLPQLAQRNRDEAAAACSHFLDTFHELLSRLIGASLTERLLRTVWGPPMLPLLNSPPMQDPTP